MKTILPLLAALAATASLQGASLTANSSISAVTVYGDRAVVTRTATLDVPAGTHDIVFENLPAILGDQSLQVSGRGTASATILDISARQTFVAATPNERIRALEDEIRDLMRQTRVLDDRVTVINEQRDFIRRMLVASTAGQPGQPAPAAGAAATRPGLEEWRQLQAYSEESQGRFATELQGIDRQKEDLNNRRTALERQLAELRGAGGRSQKAVTVRVDAATAGSLQVSVLYTVPNASWVPAYDARLRSATRSVELSYFGVVRQNTGEDWNNVALTLSTARPSLGGAAPEVPQWIVNTQQLMEAMSMSMPAQARAMGGGGGGGGRGGRGGGAAAPAMEMEMMADAVMAKAEVDIGVTSATFRVAAPATIPANNTTQKVAVTGTSLAATLLYNTTPKLRESAFLVATATNTSEFPLLAGSLNSFLDDVFIATSSLKTVMPGEKFELALGADDGISVKRRVVNRFVENTGLTNSGRRTTYEFAISVTNNKRTAERIALREPFPVSRHEQIVVRMVTPTESEVGKADRGLELVREPNGALAWKFELQPGGKRDITLKFSVEHPAELPVTGLE